MRKILIHSVESKYTGGPVSAPHLPDHVDFHGNRLFVTRHALDRFIERFAKVNPSDAEAMKNPLRTIRKMLAKSQKMELDPKVRLMRLLNNHCRLAEYWIHPETKLRFVIIYDHQNEDFAFVTVEQPNDLREESLRPTR